MSITVRIEGLDKVQRMLGTNFAPVMQASTRAIAHQLQNEIAPYPASTIANSPANPKGRWYERGYGPKWRVKSGAVHGKRSSQTLGRRWGIRSSGPTGHILGNLATYSGVVHAAEIQAAFHGARGWVTDETAIMRVVRSGAIQRIMGQAIMAALRR